MNVNKHGFLIFIVPNENKSQLCLLNFIMGKNDRYGLVESLKDLFKIKII